MIGVISDTHGLVRPQIFDLLQGADLIIHAGDIGDPEVLKALETIAPVKAVRGNNDPDSWASGIPDDRVIEYGAYRFYVLHELKQVDLDSVDSEISAVIYGHSHRPLAETRNGILYLNPGSVGPRRFSLPTALAKLHVTHSGLVPEILHLRP